ncbi:MAG: ABC transporter permease [Gammaproteobacteria bacterium]|nr:ABC transporter permease [Gammaproteobacteria bacterium]
MIRRFLAVLRARNMEFLRDRSSLGWNLLVPALLVLGIAWIFSEDDRALFKVGVLQDAEQINVSAHPFLSTKHIHFFATPDEPDAIHKISRHQMDMLLRFTDSPTYWVNEDSPRGYVLEKMFLGSGGSSLKKAMVSGRPVRYIDWLLPGILAMNMMFSCLFGVGYVVVRYRKNGYLKRLNATPLRAIEFISAQIASRLLITLVSTALVFLGTSYFLEIRMDGSYLQLVVVATLGAISLIALALVVASRVTSEELASGLLNFVGWPMMLLSGVWFSMEGANEFLRFIAQLLPLTHVLEAARATMIDGVGWTDITNNLIVLAGMAVVLMTLGAALFKWRAD